MRAVSPRGLLDLARYRAELLRHPKPENVVQDDWNSLCWKRHFLRLDDWLDGQPAVRVLETPDLAQIVVDSLFHFAGERYTLFAFVVMPSHIHWLFQPLPEWVGSLPDNPSRSPRERITYSINRFTATQCNRLLNQGGHFWHPESYDHWVRDEDELERIIGYIEGNPVKACLAECPTAGDSPPRGIGNKQAPNWVCHLLQRVRFLLVGQDSNLVSLFVVFVIE